MLSPKPPALDYIPVVKVGLSFAKYSEMNRPVHNAAVDVIFATRH